VVSCLFGPLWLYGSRWLGNENIDWPVNETDGDYPCTSKAMAWVVCYVENQREHHAKRSTHTRLERVDIEKGKPVETGSLEMSRDRDAGRKRPA